MHTHHFLAGLLIPTGQITLAGPCGPPGLIFLTDPLVITENKPQSCPDLVHQSIELAINHLPSTQSGLFVA